jgi:hypothetical protein
MKKLLSIVVLGLTAICPTFGETLEAVELATTKITLVGQGVTNITTPIFVGKDGFSVFIHQAGTNATTANLNVQASVSPNGTLYNTANTVLGNVAQAGVTPVRGIIYIPTSTIGNVAAIKITLTNAHTEYVIISNVVVSTWR